VTGCSRGIGLEVTRLLLAEGWHVYGVSRSEPPIADDADPFTWLSYDVGSASSMDKLAFRIKNRLGKKLDALVHCAAVQGPIGPLDQVPAQEWVQTIETNLIGAYLVARACLPFLKQSEDGRILLFAGGGAFNARPNYSAYAASKSAVVSLVETLAEELKGTAVTVNGVSPGFVPTAIHQATLEAGADVVGELAYRQVTDGLFSDDDTAMQRALECIHHLLSPATRGLTGKTISAEFDAWQGIEQETVGFLNESEMGTRRRQRIWSVASDGSWTYRTESGGPQFKLRESA
jgi:3-oxoacyl-[acyl-carrier protein] reductase